MEVRFMVVLLGSGVYRILALLWILMFDFYMILYSRQLIYLIHFFSCKVKY